VKSAEVAVRTLMFTGLLLTPAYAIQVPSSNCSTAGSWKLVPMTGLLDCRLCRGAARAKARPDRNTRDASSITRRVRREDAKKEEGLGSSTHLISPSSASSERLSGYLTAVILFVGWSISAPVMMLMAPLTGWGFWSQAGPPVKMDAIVYAKHAIKVYHHWTVGLKREENGKPGTTIWNPHEIAPKQALWESCWWLSKCCIPAVEWCLVDQARSESSETNRIGQSPHQCSHSWPGRKLNDPVNGHCAGSFGKSVNECKLRSRLELPDARCLFR